MNLWILNLLHIHICSLGERASFVFSLLLAMAFLMAQSFDLMPDSSEAIPLYSYFLASSILIMCLLTISLCYTISIHYANIYASPMPDWMRSYVLNWLTPILGIKTKQRQNWRQKLEEVDRKYHHLRSQIIKQKKQIIQNGSNNCFARSDDFVRKVLTKKLSFIVEKIVKVDHDRLEQREWQTVALTLDTIFFYLFFGAFIILLFSCTIKACSVQ